LAHAKVETRIASTLLALLPEFGKGGGANGHPRIFLTRKELAELTGTTPETAIRTTKHLERQGILDLTRPGIIKILKQDDLRALTD
jgi:CRP/FNR family transcriptional regulator